MSYSSYCAPVAVPNLYIGGNHYKTTLTHSLRWSLVRTPGDVCELTPGDVCVPQAKPGLKTFQHRIRTISFALQTLTNMYVATTALDT